MGPRAFDLYHSKMGRLEMANRIESLEERAPITREQVNEWVSVEDRMPEVGDNVIGCGTWVGEINGKGNGVFVGAGIWMFSGYISMESDAYSTDIIDVTHWMPLPPPPSG